MVFPETIADSATKNREKSPAWLRVAFWISIAISVAVVLRRLAALAAPDVNAPPQMAQLDNTFASHTALTLAHIIPALLFVLVAPFIVFRRAQRVILLERAFYILGVIVGLTAYAMSTFSVGGWLERSAVLVFDSFYLFSLSRAFIYRQRLNVLLERRWQLRALAVLLGIATTRPVMGVFFATARLTHLVPAQFFGIAFWIGFSINVLAFELWLRSVDRRHAHQAPTLLREPQTRSVL
ncbi:MAG TPA: DUF2306 domain-containing protein [Terracidiphilus sp.]|jgi:hypothetical protein